MINRSYPLLIRIMPMLTIMGIIFWLSHQPADELELPSLPFLDKIAHFLIYGLLALTVLWVPSARFKCTRPLTTCVVVLLICIVYGVTDEFHQSFISGRYVSGGDLIADGAGAFTMCLLWFRRKTSLQQ